MLTPYNTQIPLPIGSFIQPDGLGNSNQENVDLWPGPQGAMPGELKYSKGMPQNSNPTTL